MIEGFSLCLKRSLPGHLGCRSCLNFFKLSSPLFSQHQQKKKKKVIKIAAFFLSFICWSSPSSVHPELMNKDSAGLTRNRSSLICFYWILFVSALFFFAYVSVLPFLKTRLVGTHSDLLFITPLNTNLFAELCHMSWEHSQPFLIICRLIWS